jgi:hypothetical protein
MFDVSRWAGVMVVPVALFTASCDKNESLTAPGASQSTSVTVLPTSIMPQFVSDSFCPLTPPFVAVVNVTVSSATDLFLQAVRFDLLDRFGGRAVPTVSLIPIPDAPSAIPTSTPVPMPNTMPIPFPGQVSFGGQQVVSGQPRTDVFSLRFDCGVLAAGILSIDVDSINRQGFAVVSRTSVRMGMSAELESRDR